MNQYKKLLAFILLLSSSLSIVAYRSQGRDAVRKLVGEVGHTHLYGMDDYYGTFDIMAEYTRSFHPNRIAECLFRTTLPAGSPQCSGEDICESRCIQIQGSQVVDRNANAWLADYFYLPTDFESSFCITPRVSNALVNFDLFLGLDPWICGGYFRIYGPVCWTKWELNFCECVTTQGTNSYEAGYFGPNAILSNQLLTSFSDYASGRAPASVDNITFNGLRFSQIRSCDDTKLGFADLRFELGWDFLLQEDYYVGINLQGAAPTGSKKTAVTIFDPIVGNGNHWELGAGFDAGYIFWNGCDGNVDLGIYLDGNITHLFGTHAQKTFDLCGRPNSRYMLASRFGANVTPLGGRTTAGTGAPFTLSSNQFALEYTPVANLTTVETKIFVGVQADIVAMFNYRWCNFSWDLGYNFWGRSCEKFSCHDARSCGTQSLLDTEAGQGWGLKGDARTFGFVQGTTTAVALAPTQNSATINTGLNALASADVAAGINDPVRQNAGVDRRQFAVSGATGATQLTFQPNGPVAGSQILTSIQPIFITADDIAFDLTTRSLSHKVFTHLSYTWEECSDYWIPYLGIGGFAEFGQKEKSFDNAACGDSSTIVLKNGICKNCINCPLSQWGVWAKGGVSFQNNNYICYHAPCVADV